MTKAGKYLVFANLFVGLGLFAWALSLYANRPAWFDQKDGGDTGRFTVLKKQIEELSGSVRASQNSYARAAENVRAFEQERDFRANVLNNRLLLVRQANNPNAFFRVQLLLNDPRFPGLINVRQEGPPLKGVRNNDLQGLGFLKIQTDNAVRDEKTTLDRIVKARDDLQKLSARTEVVQVELFKQKDIKANLGEEKTYLADVQVNWDEQLRVLERRKAQLLARLEQLGVNPKVSRADR